MKERWRERERRKEKERMEGRRKERKKEKLFHMLEMTAHIGFSCSFCILS